MPGPLGKISRLCKPTPIEDSLRWLCPRGLIVKPSLVHRLLPAESLASRFSSEPTFFDPCEMLHALSPKSPRVRHLIVGWPSLLFAPRHMHCCMGLPPFAACRPRACGLWNPECKGALRRSTAKVKHCYNSNHKRGSCKTSKVQPRFGAPAKVSCCRGSKESLGNLMCRRRENQVF